ncbi:uncharacterized protein B0H18DRAFT_63513 [Fomitopsis serialis]|uniref:uncharacterized protein n=1 Tax=Fomitopsis serialis TaxID=139415 RepID=UPI002008094F|nr:uncharacterized protein B0H18DRAFT_63513 [Neoantrodia serialis]KAH9916653.1 hypothetical protein B0H18DRAFT_63513 [Neoantrodia serialis]
MKHVSHPSIRRDFVPDVVDLGPVFIDYNLQVPQHSPQQTSRRVYESHRWSSASHTMSQDPLCFASTSIYPSQISPIPLVPIASVQTVSSSAAVMNSNVISTTNGIDVSQPPYYPWDATASYFGGPASADSDFHCTRSDSSMFLNQAWPSAGLVTTAHGDALVMPEDPIQRVAEANLLLDTLGESGINSVASAPQTSSPVDGVASHVICEWGDCFEKIERTKNAVMRHLQSVHSGVARSVTEGNRMRCLWIGCKHTTTMHATNIWRHVYERHAHVVERMKCPYCEQDFTRKGSLERHMRRAHYVDIAS